MANILVKAAETVGRMVGTFRRSRHIARYGRRPPFFSAWAAEGKHRHQGYSEIKQQAQRRAIQNSWVFTAISLIARETSAAKFQVVEHKGVDEEPTQIPNHPLEERLRHPNEFIGQSFLWQYTAWWLQLGGNAYWFLALGPTGQLEEIWPLPAKDVYPVPGDAQRFIDHYVYKVGGTEYEIPAEYIVHIKLPNPYDIFEGMSPLTAAMMPVDTDNFMSRWNATFFGRDNVMPSAVINLDSGDPDNPVDPADAQMLKDDLLSEYQAFKRKVAVTTATKMSVELLGWNQRDLDFFQGRQFTKEEIYEIYGIPGGFFDKNATRANSENAEKVLTDKTVWPFLKLIAEQITVELVIPFYGKNFAAAFKDIRKTSRELELQEISAAGPYLSIDEIRIRYWGLKALPNGRGEMTSAEQQTSASSFGGGSQENPFTVEGELVPPRQLLPSETVSGPPEPSSRPRTNNRPSPQDSLAVSDIKKWRRKAINSIKRKRPLPLVFDSEYIPIYIAAEISRGLAAGSSMEEVKAVFQGVAAHYPFWSAVKAPLGKLGRPWDRWEEYLRLSVQRLFEKETVALAKLAKEQGPQAVLGNETFWMGHRERLFNRLYEGLHGIARLGLRHGQHQIGVRMQDAINWELVNQQAADWARQRAAELVTGVTDTTKQKIREAVADWVESGEGLPGLVGRIRGTREKPGPIGLARARVIAETEATATYAEGNTLVWEAAGIAPAAYKPPAHVRCRCYLQPHRLPSGVWVMKWYTVRDEQVCKQPLRVPWMGELPDGRAEGCRELHGRIISHGEWLGKRA